MVPIYFTFVSNHILRYKRLHQQRLKLFKSTSDENEIN